MIYITEVEVARCYTQNGEAGVVAVDLCLMMSDGTTREQYVEVQP